MTSTLIDNIGLLVTNDPTVGPLTAERTNAAVVIEDDRIQWVGDAGAAPDADGRLDAEGRCVIPGFVDSHSHLVFAGDRSAEFEHRMTGHPYAAGGIRGTVAATRASTDAELRANAARLVAEMRAQGTTTVEIKSGYGLTVADEARSAGHRVDAHHRNHLSRCARGAGRVRATTRQATSISSPERCSTRAPRTRGGSTCSATAARSMWTKPERS